LKYITSRANASVRRALALHNKKGRDKNDAFLTEGFILIKEAISAGREIEQIFLRGEAAISAGSETKQGFLRSDEIAEEIRAGIPDSAEILTLPEKIFDEIADTVTPQGVMAIVKKPNAADAKKALTNSSSILVLDRLQDPGNVGTLIRTAFASGIGAVACVKGTADVYALKVVRAAAGALFRIPVAQTGSAAETIAELKKAEYSLKTLQMDGGKAYSKADLSGRVAIIVGNEGSGVSDAFVAEADEIISIPMQEGAESLNAAIAAGIVLYERNRQYNENELY
jgi:TrmH family RNA methyltransferase